MVVVRNMEHKDIPDALRVLNEAWAVVDYEQAKITATKILHDYRYRTLVAMHEGKVAGFLMVWFETKMTHNSGKVGHIEDVVVTEALRGKGVGLALMSHAKEVCRANDCYKCIIHCQDHNVQFYEKCGFKVTEHTMRYDFE